MAWPTPQDYNEAVQNPRLAFTDPDLRNGQPELNALGLPRPISGNFACVYKIQSGGHRWAARCFISEVSDQQRRYEAIRAFLARAALPYTVPFTYLPTGINVQGRNYPLLKMQWVQGESLSAFVGGLIVFDDQGNTFFAAKGASTIGSDDGKRFRAIKGWSIRLIFVTWKEPIGQALSKQKKSRSSTWPP
jgi:hypothetical protein